MQFVFKFLVGAMDYAYKVHDVVVGYQVGFQLCGLCQHLKGGKCGGYSPTKQSWYASRNVCCYCERER